MKRILFSALALMAGVAFSLQAQTASDEQLGSKIGSLVGTTQGAKVREMLIERTDDEHRAVYNQQFLDGFKTVLLSDTVNTGYLDGIGVGLNMLQAISELSVANIPIDRNVAYDAFAQTITGAQVPQAVRDSLDRELAEALRPLQEIYISKKMAAEQAKHKQVDDLAAANLKVDTQWLDSLRRNDADVKTTATGLSYKVVREGKGARVQPSDKVKVNYVGRLTDGTIFDRSKDEPATFSASQVIPGFAEGLTMMNRGSKYILYIPSNLAYGRQAPPVIGPERTLIFEVEVVE